MTDHEKWFMNRLPEPARDGYRLFKSLNRDALWTDMDPGQRRAWCRKAAANLPRKEE